MLQSDRSPGLVCTFYSYKGGVGRSMALANVAALLARYGRKVLVVDWDLEAPGLEKFFGKHLVGSRRDTKGLLDLVVSMANGKPLDWRSCLLKAALPESQTLSILHAGQEGPDYFEKLRALDWDVLFREKNLGRALDALRDEWISEYDIVAIDSRTGITDVGGICSILLPDYLVCLFTTNEQSLAGVKDTMIRARAVHADLPLDRRRLIVIPVPARDESNSEYKLAADWRTRFARELSQFYDWIPKDPPETPERARETPERVLDYLKIPYVSYWSFGERLPVLEEDADNPKTLAHSYAILARLIDSKLNWTEVKQGRQAAEAELAQRAESEKKAAEALRIREEAQRIRAETERKKAEDNEERFREALSVADVRFHELTSHQEQKDRRARTRALALTLGAFASAGFLGLLLVSLRFKYFVAYFLSNNADSSLLSFQSLLAIVAIVCLGFALAWRKRSRRALWALGLLEREQAAFRVRSDVYAHLGDSESLRLFALRIEQVESGLEPSIFAELLSLFGGYRGEAVRVESLATPVAPRYPAPAGKAWPAESALIAPQPQRSTTGVSMPTPAVSMGNKDSRAHDVDGSADLVLSYAPSALTRGWLREFLPLLESWLGEYLGRHPQILDPADRAESDPAPDAAGPGHDLRAVSAHGMALVIVSRAYIQTERAMNDIEWLRHQAGPSRIVSVLLDRGFDLPPILRDSPTFDFSDFAFIGEGFSKSERYIDFQAKVRELARGVADTIETSNAVSPSGIPVEGASAYRQAR